MCRLQKQSCDDAAPTYWNRLRIKDKSEDKKLRKHCKSSEKKNLSPSLSVNSLQVLHCDDMTEIQTLAQIS